MLIGPVAPDNDGGLRARAQIAELQGQHARADWWFARAVAEAPSIPFAYTDWGHALLARGEPMAAIAKFTLANQKGPHFADPLEGWGEALMAKNHSDLALAKFAEADKYAPNWGRLHLKWGEALAVCRQEGRGEEAIRPRRRARSSRRPKKPNSPGERPCLRNAENSESFGSARCRPRGVRRGHGTGIAQGRRGTHRLSGRPAPSHLQRNSRHQMRQLCLGFWEKRHGRVACGWPRRWSASRWRRRWAQWCGTPPTARA